MDARSFIGKVQSTAQLPDFDAAMGATRATLQTLGERLAGGEPKDLASQLPNELKPWVEEGARSGPQVFDAAEFAARVSRRQGVDTSTGAACAIAVMETLRDAVTPGELGDVVEQLPKDLKGIA